MRNAAAHQQAIGYDPATAPRDESPGNAARQEMIRMVAEQHSRARRRGGH